MSWRSWPGMRLFFFSKAHEGFRPCAKISAFIADIAYSLLAFSHALLAIQTCLAEGKVGTPAC